SIPGGTIGVGGRASIDFVPSTVGQFYGTRTPLGISAYVRVRPKLMASHDTMEMAERGRAMPGMPGMPNMPNMPNVPNVPNVPVHRDSSRAMAHDSTMPGMTHDSVMMPAAHARPDSTSPASRDTTRMHVMP